MDWGFSRKVGVSLALGEQHHQSHCGHGEVFGQGDGGDGDVEDLAHAGTGELFALSHGVEDSEGAETEQDDCGKVGGLRLPTGEVGEAQAEFEKRIEKAVSARAGGEEIVFGKAGGEGGEVKEFDHGEDDEEEAHEVVHPNMPRPRGIGNLLGRGGSCGEEDNDEEWGVCGETPAIGL